MYGAAMHVHTDVHVQMSVGVRRYLASSIIVVCWELGPAVPGASPGKGTYLRV